MNKIEMTETIISAKREQGLTWEAIAEQMGMAPVWVTAVCLGQSSMPQEHADKLCAILGLNKDVCSALQDCPHKGSTWTVPTDPLIYRFYEITQVYGDTIKALIHEKFGDGIMSAIDFTMDIAKQEDPKGDRVVVTMSGKYLPYKIW